MISGCCHKQSASYRNGRLPVRSRVLASSVVSTGRYIGVSVDVGSDVPSPCQPVTGRQVVGFQHVDVALVDAQDREHVEAASDQRAGDAASTEGWGHDQVLQIPAAPIMTAHDAANDLPIDFCDQTEPGIARQVGLHRSQRVGLPQGDAESLLQKRLHRTVVADQHGPDAIHTRCVTDPFRVSGRPAPVAVRRPRPEAPARPWRRQTVRLRVPWRRACP